MGLQGESVTFSVEDKLASRTENWMSRVAYIEGGWAGIQRQGCGVLPARVLVAWRAKLAAFGSTAHPKKSPAEDGNLRALLDAKTPQ